MKNYIKKILKLDKTQKSFKIRYEPVSTFESVEPNFTVPNAYIRKNNVGIRFGDQFEN